MSPVTSSETHTCGACLGPIGAGQPFINCAASGNRYHVYCWAMLEERPAKARPHPSTAKAARGKRTNTRTRLQPARV